MNTHETWNSITNEFLVEFKNQTESNWQDSDINPAIYGFQFQRGTRWNEGLSENEINSYESDLGVRFPIDFKLMLHFMNGTDLPTVNVYGLCGEPYRYSVGVYAYPRDLSIVQNNIQWVVNNRDEIVESLQEQGFSLKSTDQFIPIYGHRYILCGANIHQSTILSIMDTDAIVYGDSLKTYLIKEFLSK